MDVFDCVVLGLPASVRKEKTVKSAQEEDNTCRKVMNPCFTGWPEKCQLDQDIKPYCKHRMDFQVANNFLVKRQRLVLPQTLRVNIVECLHERHQGFQNAEPELDSLFGGLASPQTLVAW